MVGFVRTIEDGREADFRLANHRLQPLGHLTAARFLSIRQCWSYGNPNSERIVPEIVPTNSAIAGVAGRLQRLLESREKVAVLS